MARNLRNYDVLLEHDGRQRVSTQKAETHSLAVKKAIEEHHGATPTLVRFELGIIGTCGLCHGYIYDGEKVRHRGDELRCESCP